jgi:hypothetical protein
MRGKVEGQAKDIKPGYFEETDKQLRCLFCIILFFGST